MLTPKPSSYYTGLGLKGFANPKAQLEKPCLYNVKYDKNNLANLFAPESDETIRLTKESRSKLCKDKYVQSLEKEVDELESETAEFSNEYDLLSQECLGKDILCVSYKSMLDSDNYCDMAYTRHTQTRRPQLPQTFRNSNPRVSTSTGVTHKTSVSRPQLRSTQMKEKVVPNNSQVKLKKKEVKDHHRISSFSNKTNSVIACNDNLKSRTSNVKAVCVACGKSVFNLNHDACVSKFINDVSARTKKPQVVPITARKPTRKANQSVATPNKKTVASESTI
ncbi:hypothetical protein Tco_0822565 [Tanacetum coccineum]|uniref:Gag-Pol polyprotein n=1 Tax=Tanacetum coccineum TaxID=301880 RepID=A0ABQ5AJM0_9ASTR